MDSITNLDIILERTTIANEIENILKNFDNKNNYSKKGIYVYGDNGIGKTKFILNLMKKLEYDVLYFDNSIIRNKNLLDTICSNNLSNVNIYSLFNDCPKKIVIVIDDIDNMNYGDKNGIISLIKLIRIKKTKKQKLENITNNPIICINNKTNDKKILELMKVCNIFEIKKPTNNQILKIVNILSPNLFKYKIDENEIIKENTLKFLNNNFICIKKLLFYEKNNLIYEKFYNNYANNLNNDNNNNNNNNNDNIKILTKKLMHKYYHFNEIKSILESDRTTLSLLFHENIIQLFDKNQINIYLNILDNYIFCDYIDRIIFQKQIWQLTEINYIIKIFFNNYLLKINNLYKNINIENIIFTKILTKYSSEYNNYVFIYNLLQCFLIDKKDLFILFSNLDSCNDINNILSILKNYNISKLEVVRIIKLINNILHNENHENIENIENIENDETYENHILTS